MTELTLAARTQVRRSRRVRRIVSGLVPVLAGMLCAASAAGSPATYRSANFVVTAASQEVARSIAEAAEECRLEFASNWLGETPRQWTSPCRIAVEEASSGGEGWISYETFRGRAENLQIRVQGRLDRIVEYVLPHEVAHATLVISLGRPLPRWADEGAALLAESESQRVRQRAMVRQFIAANRMMPLSDVLGVVEYPAGRGRLSEFYAASFSLTEYLVNRGGRQRLLEFVRDGDLMGWESAALRHYDSGLNDLEEDWRQWRLQSPNEPSAHELARVDQASQRPFDSRQE